jgi:hypothetical protein
MQIQRPMQRAKRGDQSLAKGQEGNLPEIDFAFIYG